MEGRLLQLYRYVWGAILWIVRKTNYYRTTTTTLAFGFYSSLRSVSVCIELQVSMTYTKLGVVFSCSLAGIRNNSTLHVWICTYVSIAGTGSSEQLFKQHVCLYFVLYSCQVLISSDSYRTLQNAESQGPENNKIEMPRFNS